jgi:hypothetical protein
MVLVTAGVVGPLLARADAGTTGILASAKVIGLSAARAGEGATPPPRFGSA